MLSGLMPCSLHWVVTALLVFQSPTKTPTRLRFDFDSPKSLNQWTADPRLKFEQKPVTSPNKNPDRGPSGKCIRIHAAAGTALSTKLGDIPSDWRKFGELTFWVSHFSSANPVFEIRLLEADRRAYFWRKIELTSQEWTKITLPLRWFRNGDGRVPEWNQIRLLEFRFRRDADLQIDSMRTVPGDANVTSRDLIELAFPGNAAKEARSADNRDAVIITNFPDLNTEKLLPHLSEVKSAVRKRMPFLREPTEKPTLIIFTSRDAYRDFTINYAKMLGAEAQAPASAGFTIEGIATSFVEALARDIRPTWTHEYVHAYLFHALSIQNKSEWLQEGLAVYFQLQFHPQANMGKLVLNGVADERQHTRLRELCAGQPISMNRYWQATTFVDMLMTSDRYGKSFKRLTEALRAAGSTDLSPHVEPILGSSWDQLELDWRDFCRKKYEVAAPNQPKKKIAIELRDAMNVIPSKRCVAVTSEFIALAN